MVFNNLEENNVTTAVLLVSGFGPPGPLEKETMTKKPETDYDVAAAVPCCKNEENSPRKAGCPSIEKVVVMLLQEAQTGLLAPIPAEAQ